MSPVVRSPALVGRGAELASVRGLVDAVPGGGGATLLITGEAGIGKSRLLGEMASRAAERGLTVLRGRSVQGGGTYRPVAEALARPLRGLPLSESALSESALPESARLRPFRAALRRLVPGWAEAVEPDGPADAGQGPVSDPAVVLGEGVLALLRELDDGGCAVLLEDLHWADAETLGLVAYLADAVTGTPVLLGLTARDDVAVPAVAGLAAHPAVRVLGLTRLDRAGVAALAAACRDGDRRPSRSWTRWSRARKGCRTWWRSCSIPPGRARSCRRRSPAWWRDGSRRSPRPGARCSPRRPWWPATRTGGC